MTAIKDHIAKHAEINFGHEHEHLYAKTYMYNSLFQ